MEPTIPHRSIAKRWWLNLALAALVIGLGVAVWHISRTDSEDKRTLLTSISKSGVQSVEITRANQPPVVLEKADDRWRLLAPIKARANPHAVDLALSVLDTPSEGTVPVDGGDLGRYGLAKPALTARYDNATIEFGERHPIKSATYVRYNGSVHLISALHQEELSRPYNVYIDTRPIEEDYKPTRFELPGFRLVLKNGEWQREPHDKELSSDRINAFVDGWRQARAFTVKRHDGQAIGERVRVTLEDPSGKSTTLTFGILQRQPELLLVRTDENLVYHFPESAAAEMLKLGAERKP
jgi:hypothetical protein